MAQCQGPRAEMIRLFLVSTHIWQKEVALIPKVPGAPRNNMVRRRLCVTIYCTIFNNNSPSPRQFLLDKILKKKLARGMLIERITEFGLRKPGPPSRACTFL